MIAPAAEGAVAGGAVVFFTAVRAFLTVVRGDFFAAVRAGLVGVFFLAAGRAGLRFFVAFLPDEAADGDAEEDFEALPALTRDVGFFGAAIVRPFYRNLPGCQF